MALTLTVRSGAPQAPKVTFDSPKVMLGRSLGCDLVLPDPSVSQRHASLRQRGSEYIVLDEGSSNGTFVGPVRLSEGTPRVLKSGDLLRLGRIWLEVTLEAKVPAANTKDLTKEIALQLIEGALTSEGAADVYPQVAVESGPDQGKLLSLVNFNEPYVVGRGKTCALPLEDADCSRRHIEITRKGTRILVKDLGSKNGATLAEQILEGAEPSHWQPGVPLRFGQTELRLTDPVSSMLRELEAAADEVVTGSVDPPEVETKSTLDSARPPPGNNDALPRGKIAEVPARRAKSAAPAHRREWDFADVLILGVALLVLIASGAGLWWLLR
jgi:pSer/pThr/pTyr-binding forkhead associated (FHA) protein